MKIDFSRHPPIGIDNISKRFHENIEVELGRFIRVYTPYLRNAMTRIISDFTDDPVINFSRLIDGVSEELRRIKEDAKESDNPLADVEGVSSF
jgi:hypothetical protein